MECPPLPNLPSLQTTWKAVPERGRWGLLPAAALRPVCADLGQTPPSHALSRTRKPAPLLCVRRSHSSLYFSQPAVARGALSQQLDLTLGPSQATSWCRAQGWAGRASPAWKRARHTLTPSVRTWAQAVGDSLGCPRKVRQPGERDLRGGWSPGASGHRWRAGPRP